jgi:hypothetical protein
MFIVKKYKSQLQIKIDKIKFSKKFKHNKINFIFLESTLSHLKVKLNTPNNGKF